MNRAIRCAVLSLLVAGSIVAAGGPATGSSGVRVLFEVSHGAHRPAPLLACGVDVPAGANGLAVLDAAVGSGCIRSYSTQHHPSFGRYVDCIDDVCHLGDGLVSYWSLFFDDAYADSGLEGFQAAQGREIELTYTSVNCWVGVC